MVSDSESKRARVFKSIRRNFITGLIVLTPLIAMILIMKWLFGAIAALFFMRVLLVDILKVW